MSLDAPSETNSKDRNAPILGLIPLNYTYLLWYHPHANTFLYSSNSELWRPVDQSNSYISNFLNGDYANYRIIDNYSDIKLASPSIDSISVIDNRNTVEQVLSISIKSNDIVADHLKILKAYRQYDVKSVVIDISKNLSLIKSNVIASDLKVKLDQLAKACNVEILISRKKESFAFSSLREPVSNNNTRVVYAYIIGDSDCTLVAQTKLRLLLDDEAGLFVDAMNFPLSAIPSIGGVDFGNLKAIAKETGVNIYLPSLVPQLWNCDFKDIPNMTLLHFTGLDSQVQLAKKFLLEIRNKDIQVEYKSLEILKYKKDFILLNRKNAISTIMYKYGVFIQLPALGSDDSLIHFQGPSSDLIELAIEEFLGLCNGIITINVNYSTEITLGDASWSEVHDLLANISSASNTTIYADRSINSFQVIGLQDDVIKDFKVFHSYATSIFGKQNYTIRTELELGLSYHEFISGKKNGKINKIMGSSNCSKIRFHSLNDYTFKIELLSTAVQDFFNSYLNLQNEFPSEFKFYLPESFHRQIIGTGGSLIQSIMRKYNVFVKFLNQYDMSLSNAKNLVRFDNVIIKCPFKNSSNIPLVQNELNTIIWNNNENNNIFNTYVKINRNQYRLFDYRRIQEIEKKNQAFIKFPSAEFPEPYHIVEILGVDKNSIGASKALTAELANGYEFKISYSSKFARFFNDENEIYLERIRVPFKVLYNFEILPVANSSTSKNSNTPHHSIILSYHTENDLFLDEAIQHLTQFLREFEFMILDRDDLSKEDLIINGSAVNATITPLPLQQKQIFQAKQLYPQYGQNYKTSTGNGYRNTLYQQNTVSSTNNSSNFSNQRRPNTSHNGYDSNSFSQKRPFS